MSFKGAINKAKSTIKTPKRTKKFTDDEESKVSSEWLHEKVLEVSKDSPWSDSEVLYWTTVNSQPKTFSKGSDTSVYLFFYYKAETSVAYIVKFTLKGKDMKINQSWSFSELKKIDCSDSQTSFMLSLDNDYKWTLATNMERDEAVWIIINICRKLVGLDIKISQSVDMNILSLSSSSALARFPALRKYFNDSFVSLNSSSDDVTFSAEDTEAEKLFDELHWSVDGGDPSDLQRILKNESDSLHIDICDFLLQWETEGEEVRRQEKYAVHGGGGGGDEASSSEGSAGKGYRPTSKAMAALKVDADGSASSSRVRETISLLVTLARLDEELLGVDAWLAAQIDHLAGVKSELRQIETENSVLETSWHNLCSVKVMATELVATLQISPIHENTLKMARKIVSNALADKTLSNTDEILKGLMSAIGALKTSLTTLRGGGEEGGGVSASEWQHLASLACVVAHRKRLVELSEQLCSSMDDFSTSLFPSLLDLRIVAEALQADSPTLITSRYNSLASALSEITAAQRQFIDQCEMEQDSGDPSSSSVTVASDVNLKSSLSSSTDFPPPPPSATHLMAAQRIYHEAIVSFLPLIESLSDLSFTLAEQFRHSYIMATQSHFYVVMIRNLFKDIQKLICSRQTSLSLATIVKSSSPRDKHPTPITFQHSASPHAGSKTVANLSISPWVALPVLLGLIQPVMERESTFLQQVIIRHDIPAETREVMLQEMFASFKDKLLKFVGSSDTFEGVEVVAAMTTVEMMGSMGRYRTSSMESTRDSADAVAGAETSSTAVFVSSCLWDMKEILVKQLAEFTASQVTWIYQQKGDPKKPIVLLPVAKFPSLIDQVLELSGNQEAEYVENFLTRIGKELLAWLQIIADQNAKYREVVLIRNLSFFLDVLSSRKVPCLARLAVHAGQMRAESQQKYLDWMVSKEFPLFFALAEKIRSLGDRAGVQEMALYVKREDVAKAVSKMDLKSIEVAATATKRRLEKHFIVGVESVYEQSLVSQLWVCIHSEVVSMFRLLERVAKSSYQITLLVNAETVKTLCEKIS